MKVILRLIDPHGNIAEAREYEVEKPSDRLRAGRDAGAYIMSMMSDGLDCTITLRRAE